MPFRIPFELQAAICRAVGVDPRQTTRIVLDVNVDRPPLVRITQYVTTEQEDALVRIFDATEFEERS